MKTLNTNRNLVLTSLLSLTTICSISSCSNATALSGPQPCSSSLQITESTDTISTVESYASTIACPVPATQICTVFDIDNTLITNNPNFGDEAWGNWQEYLSRTAPTDPDLITNWLSNAGIYRDQAGIRFLINFKPVQPTTASTISSLQASYQTIALSSRGFSSMATTERQLAANNLDMAVNPIGDHQFNNIFLQQNSRKNDLLMYYNGVYYVAGENKGETLLDMINYYRTTMKKPDLCSVVVVLDDTPSKIYQITTALKDKIGYVALIYTALPEATDPTNWTPDLWRAQSVELKNTIVNLNK